MNNEIQIQPQEPSAKSPIASEVAVKANHFYCSAAYPHTITAIAYADAWKAAVRHRASNALRADLRWSMRFYAKRAVKAARVDAAKWGATIAA